jgi:glycosyltransferase involved in cell wall biosynthesis
VAFHFIRSMAERGHQLHVATTRAKISNPLPPNVHVYEKVHALDCSQPRTLSYLLWSQSVLAHVRRRRQIDLIHELNPVRSLCSLAFAGSSIPVILGPHSSRWPASTAQLRLPARICQETKAVFKDIIVRQQHRRACAILLSTPAALNNISRPDELPGRIFLLPPGLDTDTFSPAPSSAQYPPTVLFLANVLARKGIFTLLEAFQLLTPRLPNARLLVAGDGGELDAARNFVAASPCASHVSFIGRVDRPQVPEVMRQCTVYCMPSRGEPFGMTAIEAMACGKPLVVTDVGGLGHIVSDQGGRRVPVDDPPRLAYALEELLSQPELCRRMGAHNRLEAERTYAWPIVAQRLEEIYRTVLDLAGGIAAGQAMAAGATTANGGTRAQEEPLSASCILQSNLQERLL